MQNYKEAKGNYASFSFTLLSETRANVTQVLASVAHRKVTNGILRTNWEA